MPSPAQTLARSASSMDLRRVALDEHPAVRHVEVLDLLLEVLGGAVQQPLRTSVAAMSVALPDMYSCRVAVEVPDSGVDGRVGAVDRDPLQRHAQHLGRDLAQAVGLPGAQVGHAGAHGHRAVQLDAHPGLRGVVQPHDAAVALEVRREPLADLDRAVDRRSCRPAPPSRAWPSLPARRRSRWPGRWRWCRPCAGS